MRAYAYEVREQNSIEFILFTKGLRRRIYERITNLFVTRQLTRQNIDAFGN